MKQFLILILILITTRTSMAQSRQDQTQILQKCIGLPELQKYFPLEADGNLKPLVINYWHPVLFPTDLTLSQNGKNILFRLMSMESVKNGEAYFLFNKFEILQGSSVVKFEYRYDNLIQPKVLQVALGFIKSGEAWEMSTIKVSNQE